MRILFTGGSSFTGMAFVEALAGAGHEVVATMTQPDATSYEGVRGERVARVEAAAADTRYECPLGSEKFFDLLRSGAGWDLFCHHAADVTNYRSPDFDVLTAVGNNTAGARDVVLLLGERGGRVLLTGSVFEGGEGAGSENLPHFSPYGLSKALAAEVWHYEAERQGVALDKFVIPNPFGPYEEPRFTSYLMQCWFEGKVASVRTPAYVRDNIHISLLAHAYLDFAAGAGASRVSRHMAPSGYIESQGRFAERIAEAMRERLDLPCGLELAQQTEFDEPRVRINTDPADAMALGWEEGKAWDEFAAYYERQRRAT
jgi:nucleoside-diphosphate-sugar epimerase